MAAVQVPDSIVEEMEGMAAALNLTYNEVLLANLLNEMSTCIPFPPSLEAHRHAVLHVTHSSPPPPSPPPFS